jgi:uncharacterized protein YndB with AHSA1/START domain
MNDNRKFDFDVNKDTNTVNVVREFAAPLQQVWKAWTTAEMLDQWWAPKPWKARTKELNFTPGGRWLYAMVGPDSTEHWCRAIYEKISDKSSYSYDDAFCDAEGNVTDGFPGSHWDVAFADNGDMTTVTITISHKNAAGLEKILAMGFQGGFTMGLNNLDELLAGK